jgi:hypothetical protein
MKCRCETCRGSGEVECPDCDGDGDYEAGIEAAELDKNADNYEELRELKRDALRVINQAKTLKTLRPDRAGSYDLQLQAALEAINLQADKAAKK